MDSSEKLEKYLDHYCSTVYVDYNDEDNSSFHIYREDTADGHEVFVAKYKEDNHVNIMDDVYYYQHDLSSIIIEKIQESETLYVDEDLWNDLYMEDEIADLYDEEGWEDDAE